MFIIDENNLVIGHPDPGRLELKNVWAVRRDGLLFASGWHVEAEEFTKSLVDEAIARFHAEGLEETLAYYNNPDSVDVQWYVFYSAPRGRDTGPLQRRGFRGALARDARRRVLQGHRGWRVGEPRGRESRHGRGGGQTLLVSFPCVCGPASRGVMNSVWIGGAGGARTPDFLRAREALSQLSYSPTESGGPALLGKAGAIGKGPVFARPLWP